jgi:hypothetical protein
MRIRTLPEGVTVTGALVFKPPAKSLAVDWITSAAASSSVFFVQSPIGSVIDVQIVARLSNVISPISVVVVAASPGAAYYLALDGAPGNYIPVGPLTVS